MAKRRKISKNRKIRKNFFRGKGNRRMYFQKTFFETQSPKTPHPKKFGDNSPHIAAAAPKNEMDLTKISKCGFDFFGIKLALEL